MYEVFYLAKSLVFLTLLFVIKCWSFGGFGLDKTYVLLFFSALTIALPLLVNKSLVKRYRWTFSGSLVPMEEEYFCISQF